MYLPQEQMAINDKSSYADSTMITQYDTDALMGLRFNDCGTRWSDNRRSVLQVRVE